MTVVGIFALTVFVLGGAGVLYAKAKVGAISTADVGGALTPKGKTIENAGLGPTTIENYLLVGSDTRVGADPDSPDFGQIGNKVDGQRSDTIMVLRYDPKTRTGAILSFPRDLYVPIYGTSGKDKINSAFSKSAQTLIRTIEQDFGIPIHHYVEVNFEGFKALVDALGGVSIYFDAPSRDKKTGFYIQDPGCTKLSGIQALEFTRSRYWQTFTNGRWRDDAASDLGRIKRQQDFMKQALAKAVQEAASSPVTATALLNAAINNLKVDPALKSDIFGLANRLRKLGSGGLTSWTLPADGKQVGDQSVLILRQHDAQPLIDYFRGTGPEPSANGNAPAPARTASTAKKVPATTTPTTVDPAASCKA
jgi:LCP family protein required for cell wall assembly